MTHLAIGDFVFQGVYLQAFKHRFPDIQLDIWIDDCRNKTKVWHRGRNDTLVQWLQAQTFITNIYPIAESGDHREQLINQARASDYDVVFFIASQRTEDYAKFARRIAKDALAVGSRAKPFSHWLSKRWHFSRLDGYFDLELEPAAAPLHISQQYQSRFEQCVGPLFSDTHTKRELAIDVPDVFRQEMKDWIDACAEMSSNKLQRTVLINHLSTNERRNLSWKSVCDYLSLACKTWPDTLFVINVPPSALQETQKAIAASEQLVGHPVVAYSATEHFFQLPALIEHCALVVTVETAIMHLASTLRIPQVVLMRDSARAWQPVHATEVLFATKQVDDIRAEDVFEASKSVLLEPVETD